MNNNQILVIDDDAELCELLTTYLKPEGFAVTCHYHGDGAVEKLLAGDYSLLILDVMLPGKNGFDVLRQSRQHSQVPVIMLTARGDDVDRIVGLEMGADDYLPKPFNPRELVARIRSIQRRTKFVNRPSPSDRPTTNTLVVGDIALDKNTRTVHRSGQKVNLTAVEFSLLEELLLHAGKIVRREELVRIVLGRQLSPFDRSIDVHISHLRQKIGHHADSGERIMTIRGTGYQYVAPAGSPNQDN